MKKAKSSKDKRAEDFARHGSNMLEHVEAPLLLKKGQAAKLLVLPRFFKLSIVDCIYQAKRLTKGRVPCNDKATAIALILGAEGKQA